MLLGHLVLGGYLGATTFPLFSGGFDHRDDHRNVLRPQDRARFDHGRPLQGMSGGRASSRDLLLLREQRRVRRRSGLKNGMSISAWGVFICAIVGLAVTGAITYITEIYTGTQFRSVHAIAKASVTGTQRTSSRDWRSRCRRRPCRR